ncbi:hypothetical protein Glove_360g113 [Diversispora epigaea]|uniref:Uncharacterized protein n=1 Tax=Diversispora epigaea TaxID=1348612 RepID=A0A397HE80_9GLOM|nr:hypothetical protein Glove_360g113 [Diversispora epigaea]
MHNIYSDILSNNTYSRPFKFVTLMFSPLFILLYVGIILPISLQACLAHSLFITLILPIVIQVKRPEYPYYDESVLMSIIFLLYQFILGNNSIKEIKEEFLDSPILRPIQDTINLDKKFSHLYSTVIPNRIKEFIDFFYHKLRVGIVVGFFFGFFAIPITLICFFIEPPFDKAFTQLKQLTSNWTSNWYLNWSLNWSGIDINNKDWKTLEDEIEGNPLNIIFSVVMLFCLRVIMLIPLILFVIGIYLYGFVLYVYLGLEWLWEYACKSVYYPSITISCGIKNCLDSIVSCFSQFISDLGKDNECCY